MPVLPLCLLDVPGMKRYACVIAPQRCATVESCLFQTKQLLMPMSPQLPQKHHRALTTWLAMPWPVPIVLQHLVDLRGCRRSRNKTERGQEVAASPRRLPPRDTCSVRVNSCMGINSTWRNLDDDTLPCSRLSFSRGHRSDSVHLFRLLTF